MLRQLDLVKGSRFSLIRTLTVFLVGGLFSLIPIQVHADVDDGVAAEIIILKKKIRNLEKENRRSRKQRVAQN